MMTPWQADGDATPGLGDVDFMATVLEGRHGTHAAGVAEFFSQLHDRRGDAGRSWAWAGVAHKVRLRETERLIAG